MRICELTPSCENICEGNTLGCASCNHAARKAERLAKKQTVVTPVKKITAKRAAQTVEYLKLKREYLALYLVCEVDECNLKSVDVHHQKGRENNLLTDTNYFFAVCHKHHQEMTEHSKAAIEKGYSASRTAK